MTWGSSGNLEGLWGLSGVTGTGQGWRQKGDGKVRSEEACPPLRAVGRQRRDWTVALWWQGQRQSGVVWEGERTHGWGAVLVGGSGFWREGKPGEAAELNGVRGKSPGQAGRWGVCRAALPCSGGGGNAERLRSLRQRAALWGFCRAVAGGEGSSSRHWGEPARRSRAEVPCGDSPRASVPSAGTSVPWPRC